MTIALIHSFLHHLYKFAHMYFKIQFLILFISLLVTGCNNPSNDIEKTPLSSDNDTSMNPIDSVPSIATEEYTWLDSVIMNIFNNTVDIKHTSEWDTINIKSAGSYWMIDSDKYKEFYWDDMDYRHMKNGLDLIDKTALDYLKRPAKQNYFRANLGQQILDEFNVLNYGRMGKNAKYYGYTYLKDVFENTNTSITSSSVKSEDSTWLSEFKVIEQADFDADGIMDVMLNHYSSAKSSGTYRGSTNIILTKLSADSDIIYLPMNSINYHNPHINFLNRKSKGYIGNEPVELSFEAGDKVKVNGTINYINLDIEYEFHGFILGNGYIKLAINDDTEYGSIIWGRIENDILKGVAPIFDTEYSEEVIIGVLPIVGSGIVSRSDLDSISNLYNYIDISNIFGFTSKLDVNEMIQVVPLRKELPIVELPVISTEYRNDTGFDVWYELELGAIKNDKYSSVAALPEMSAEYPSDVLCIYPVQENCQLLDIKALRKDDLPINVTLDIVKGALDFNNDGIPDALDIEFCCSTRKPRHSEDCDYTCGETYVKLGEKWVMINSSQPM